MCVYIYIYIYIYKNIYTDIFSLSVYIYIYKCMKHIAIPYTLKANQEFLTHMVQETAGFVQHSQVLQGVRTQFDHIR
jgi:hypothetical protein